MKPVPQCERRAAKRRYPSQRGTALGLQQGLSLATAVFVITIMALLAALIFQLVRNNAETTQEEVLLVRSLYAAESGIQFGLNRVFPPEGGVEACPALPMFTFTTQGEGLNACTATVTCESVAVDGNSYYTVVSTGTCGGVSRKIQVRAQ